MRISDWSSDVCSSDLFILSPATIKLELYRVHRCAAEWVEVKIATVPISYWNFTPVMIDIASATTDQKGRYYAKSEEDRGQPLHDCCEATSSERRGGKEGGRTCRSWWLLENKNKKRKEIKNRIK